MTDEAVRYVTDPDLMVEDFGDDIVLLDVRTGDMHHLEPISALIWRALDTSADLSSVVARVHEHLVGPPPTAVLQASVREHIDELSELGLIRSTTDRA